METNPFAVAIHLIETFSVRTRFYVSARQKCWAKSFVRFLEDRESPLRDPVLLARFSIFRAMATTPNRTLIELVAWRYSMYLNDDLITVVVESTTGFETESFLQLRREWTIFVKSPRNVPIPTEDPTVWYLFGMTVASACYDNCIVTLTNGLVLFAEGHPDRFQMIGRASREKRVDLVYSEDGHVLLNLRVSEKQNGEALEMTDL
jgi:hypothetical protein